MKQKINKLTRFKQWVLSVISSKKERVAVGCGSCKYKRLEMCNEPCLNCIEYYSKWEQINSIK